MPNFIDIEISKSKEEIELKQTCLIEREIEYAKIEDANPKGILVAKPLLQNTKPSSKLPKENFHCRLITGMLSQIRGTRPGIYMANHQTSKHSNNPNASNFNAVNKLSSTH